MEYWSIGVLEKLSSEWLIGLLVNWLNRRIVE